MQCGELVDRMWTMPCCSNLWVALLQAELTANLHASVNGCCTGNGVRALYHAWEGITRFAEGVATVNLFLNRAAPLVVESHLPYAGRVVLRNKQAHTAIVRIPNWGGAQSASCFCSMSGWCQAAWLGTICC